MLSPAIIVGFDGTEGARAALQAAIDLADSTNQPLLVVYVEEVPTGVTAGTLMSPGASALITTDPRRVDACRRECTVILNDDDVPWAFEVRRGNPAHELAASQHAATFIVIGQQRQHGLPRHLAGSTMQRLVRHARQPVLVIPPLAPPPT